MTLQAFALSITLRACRGAAFVEDRLIDAKERLRARAEEKPNLPAEKKLPLRSLPLELDRLHKRSCLGEVSWS